MLNLLFAPASRHLGPSMRMLILGYLYTIFVVFAVEPETPDLLKESIGDDHFNVTLIPGSYNDEEQRPVGNDFYIRYREFGEDEWQTKRPDADQISVSVTGLNPGTRYEVQVVSVQTDQDGNVHENYSRTHHITTTGESPMRAKLWWIIIFLIIILLLLLLLCLICLCTRRRGQKYLVAEQERLQGREPILPKDRTFEDYAKRLVVVYWTLVYFQF